MKTVAVWVVNISIHLDSNIWVFLVSTQACCHSPRGVTPCLPWPLQAQLNGWVPTISLIFPKQWLSHQTPTTTPTLPTWFIQDKNDVGDTVITSFSSFLSPYPCSINHKILSILSFTYFWLLLLDFFPTLSLAWTIIAFPDPSYPPPPPTHVSLPPFFFPLFVTRKSI